MEIPFFQQRVKVSKYICTTSLYVISMSDIDIALFNLINLMCILQEHFIILLLFFLKHMGENPTADL